MATGEEIMDAVGSAPSTDGETTDTWTTVITPSGSIFELHLAELWRYRDLILLFVRRDFVAQYKQTILGPAWHVVQPLLTTVVFSVVFGGIAGMSTDGVPQFLFYMSGTIVWSYFAACLTKTSNTFIGNKAIFGKVYFPRLAVPVSVLLSNLISFGIQFGFFLMFLAFFMLRGSPVQPSTSVILLPFLLLIMAAQGLGLGIIVSALTTRYRDLVQVVAFGTSLLMYTTTVVYPLSTVDGTLRTLVWLNPMTAVIESFRNAFLGSGHSSGIHLIYSTLSAAVLLLIGITMFNRVERTFMDTI